jgi:hypothetical protein
MRTRINVTFEAGTRSISTGIENLSIDDIRLIINETQKEPICSSMRKDLIASISNGVVTYVESYQKVMPNGTVQTIVIPVLAAGDHITFEIDQGKIEQVLIPMTSAEVTEMVEDIIADESEES